MNAITRKISLSVFVSLAAAITVTAAEKEGKTEPTPKAERTERRGRARFLDQDHAPKPRQGWTRLFNGKDLKGWKAFPADRHNSWKVEDGGVLASLVKPGEHGTNIYTEEKYGDFEFYCEYLVPKNGNSGEFLRGQDEIQVQDDHGEPAGKKDWGNGGIYGQQKPSKNASKPQGEWQVFYATIVGKKINVWLNGEQIIKDYEPPRPTHLYGELKVKDGDPTGPIVLQGDHTAIKYRQVWIKPIKK